ncbi:MAG: DUF2027 domain-containing protein, partial [Bacteroidaceae bacterium]
KREQEREQEKEKEQSLFVLPKIVDVPIERQGADELNLFIAFLPMDGRPSESQNFEAFLINDGNYYLYYTYSLLKDGLWNIVKHGLLEPNSKESIEQFHRSMLNEHQVVALQAIPFKADRPFQMKNAVDVEQRIDVKKFYKQHAFCRSLFFNEEVLLIPIVEGDEVKKPLILTTEEVKESMKRPARVKQTYDELPGLKVLGKIDLATGKKIDPEEEKRKAIALQEKKEAERLEAERKSEAEKKRAKSSIQPELVINLHIEELLDDTYGMNNREILEYQLDKFHSVMKKFSTKKEQRIIFIHGKGEGVLRQAILQALKQKYGSCLVQDASFQEYGYGASMVTIK